MTKDFIKTWISGVQNTSKFDHCTIQNKNECPNDVHDFISIYNSINRHCWFYIPLTWELDLGIHEVTRYKK